MKIIKNIVIIFENQYYALKKDFIFLLHLFFLQLNYLTYPEAKNQQKATITIKLHVIKNNFHFVYWAIRA